MKGLEIMKNKNTMTNKKTQVLSQSASNLLSEIKNDLKKWSKTKDGKSYKLFYQLETNR